LKDVAADRVVVVKEAGK